MFNKPLKMNNSEPSPIIIVFDCECIIFLGMKSNSSLKKRILCGDAKTELLSRYWQSLFWSFFKVTIYLFAIVCQKKFYKNSVRIFSPIKGLIAHAFVHIFWNFGSSQKNH